MPLLQLLLSELCFLLLLFSTVGLAAPFTGLATQGKLVKRNPQPPPPPGSGFSNPIDASFNIAGWESIAEENCFAMLCLRNGQRVYQRTLTQSETDTNRQASGADSRPFGGGNLNSRRTAQINPRTTSAEEFPWASTRQGGEDAHVFPATREEQDSQGGSIRAGYSRASVGPGQWFRITFAGNLGLYCSALFGTPPDFSICDKIDMKEPDLFGTPNVILPDFAYHREKIGGQRGYAFYHVAGKFFGKFTKRSEQAKE